MVFLLIIGSFFRLFNKANNVFLFRFNSMMHDRRHDFLNPVFAAAWYWSCSGKRNGSRIRPGRRAERPGLSEQYLKQFQPCPATGTLPGESLRELITTQVTSPVTIASNSFLQIQQICNIDKIQISHLKIIQILPTWDPA
jgi:hypothetical protein